MAESGLYAAAYGQSQAASAEAVAKDRAAAKVKAELTDMGNAHRLVIDHRDELRHAKGIGWLAWDGQRWKPDDAEAERAAERTVRDIKREALYRSDHAESERDRDAAEAHFKWAHKSQFARPLEAMLKLARKAKPLAIEPDELDPHKWALNALNGTVDLRSGELRDHRPDDLISRLAPVKYDPDARAPRWEAFLAHVLGDDQELIAFVQRAVGYTLTADTSEQVLLLLLGNGANGKRRGIHRTSPRARALENSRGSASSRV